MASTTYRKLAEEIRTSHYLGIASDDATYSLRHIAELIANEVAWFARKNAFENSNAGEVTYANDTFIISYKAITVLIESGTNLKYIALPSTPIALPHNQEIERVWLGKTEIIPLSNHSKFSQDLLPAIKGYSTYFIENGNLYFNGQPFLFSTININMVAGFPEGNLLDAKLSLPKNYEIEIIDRVVARLNAGRGVPIDNLNDAVSIPS